MMSSQAQRTRRAKRRNRSKDAKAPAIERTARPHVPLSVDLSDRTASSLAFLGARVPLLFCITALIFGLAYLLIIPPFQVPDERGHFRRAIGVSEGTCIAGPTTPIPTSVLDMESAFPEPLDSAPPAQRWIVLADLARWMSPQTSRAGTTFVENAAADLYTCVPYLASAAFIAGGRLGGAPPLLLLYLGRLANLFCFLTLTYAALRVLPDFHLHLFGLALMPMTLHQAASLSADAVTLGATFFLLAYVLTLTFDESIGALHSRHYVILALAVVVSSLSKFNVWVLFAIALIPAGKFTARFGLWRCIASMVALGVGALFMWQWGNGEHVRYFSAQRIQAGIDMAQNSRFLMQHPLVFLSSLAFTLHDFRSVYPNMFVGRLAYLTVPLPQPLVWTYLAFLAVVACTQTWKVRLKAYQRTLVIFLFAASFISIFVVLFIVETPNSYLSHRIVAGTGYINGVQGRYFIPVALLLLIALSNRILRVPARIMFLAIIGLCVTSNLVGLQVVWRAYYQNAAARKNDGRVIVGRDGAAYLVTNDSLRRIPDLQTFRALDFKDERVKRSADSEMRSIPMGAPLPSLPGQVLQKATTGEVFLLQNGRRHHIPDPGTLDAMHLREQVNGVPDAVADAVPLGAPVPHIDNAHATALEKTQPAPAVSESKK